MLGSYHFGFFQSSELFDDQLQSKEDGNLYVVLTYILGIETRYTEKGKVAFSAIIHWNLANVIMAKAKEGYLSLHVHLDEKN